jgi:aminopeptidase N
MTEREHTFYVPLAAKPSFARVDAEVLKTLDLDLPAEMLRAQLAGDEHVLGRIEAARALGKKGDKDAIAALGKAVREGGFWGVQADAAKALGSIRSNAALVELIASTSVQHAKARRAVVRALGEFRDDRAAQALSPLTEGDASYYVQASAHAALGKTRSSTAFDILQRGLDRDSQNDVIRASAFEGFANLKDPRAVPIATEWSRYGRPPYARGSAAASLGKLAEIVPEHEKEDIIDQLTQLLDDPWMRTQLAAIEALAELKATKALPALERMAQREMDGRIVRNARVAAQRIRTSADKGEEVKKLREEVDKLTDENRGLKDRLDKIEAQISSNT